MTSLEPTRNQTERPPSTFINPEELGGATSLQSLWDSKSQIGGGMDSGT